MEINKIYNADCFDLINQLDDNSIDLLLTDPPFLYQKGGSSGKSLVGGMFNSKNESYADFKELGNFDKDKIYNFLDLIIPKLKTINCFLFCSELQVVHYLNYAIEHKLNYNILVWKRPLRILNRNRFSSNLDYIIRIYKTSLISNYELPTHYYNKCKETPIILSNKKHHLTEKPIGIFDELLLISTKENDLVLDPFIGSGTTAISCINNNRNYIGMEINTDNYNKAISRLKNDLRIKDNILKGYF